MSQPTATAQPIRQRWGVPRCGYFANAAGLWVAMRALPVAYVLVWVVAGWFFVWVPGARRGSMAYLDLLRGRRGFLTRVWQTYWHLVQFGYLLVDRAVMLAKSRHGFRLQCVGLDNIVAAYRGDSTGVVLLTAHFGVAEIGIPYLPQMGFDRPIHIVMYQELGDAQERFHSDYRRLLAGMDIISTTDPVGAGLSIMAALKKGDTVAMRADRTLAGKGIAVTLLGRRVVLPAGPFLAAVLSGAAVVYVYTCRLGYREYACRFSPPHRYVETAGVSREELLARAGQDYATHLENLLKEFPLQWSNFYDYWREQGVN